MPQNIIYALIATAIVSIISLIWILTLGIKVEKLKKILIYFIAFSAGTLMGDAFLHLLPEASHEGEFDLHIWLIVLVGIVLGLIIEKVIHRNHCHMPITKEHKHPFAWMNLVGDMVHNLIDGLIIGAAFLVDIQVGIATTIAVILHEIPQEIWDFGVLIHGGFTKKKALLMNFLTALTAFIGVGIAIVLNMYIEGISEFLMPLAAGLFIYIAGSDLIPEMHKTTKLSSSLIQILFFLAGIGIMLALTAGHID